MPDIYRISKQEQTSADVSDIIRFNGVPTSQAPKNTSADVPDITGV